MLKHVLIFCTYFVLHLFNAFSETPKNYGEFSLKLTKFEICKGPKKLDCTNLSGTVKNETTLAVTFLIKKDVSPNRGKIISLMNNNPLVRFQLKNPCQHLFMKSLFQSIFNVTSSCVFKKGIHIMTMDIEQIAQRYYGGMFLYGNMTFKSLFYNDDCNFSCTVTQVTLYPKGS